LARAFVEIARRSIVGGMVVEVSVDNLQTWRRWHPERRRGVFSRN
jgi:hypothetical protein